MSVIFNYMQRLGLPLRREGKWSCGPCPSCGGEDRFRVVRDEDKAREFFSCRQCDKRGDDVQFLCDFAGMSYVEAQEEAKRLRDGNPLPVLTTVLDEKAWHETCMDFINCAHDELLRFRRLLLALERERGILPETVKRFTLGYNPTDLWFPREVFGLTPRFRTDGRPADICLPRGYVIPVHADGVLEGVQLRRKDAYRGIRYTAVPGSTMVPMLFEGAEPGIIMVVESYLCGMLLWQELSGEVSILALGSVSAKPDAELERLLQGTKHLLIALDNDVAGRERTCRSWLGCYPGATRCAIPFGYGKDPTDAHRRGLDLREWYEDCLSRATPKSTEPVSEAPEIHEPTLCVGPTEASLCVVSDRDDARSKVAEIVRDCAAITVAISVDARSEHKAHPLAGHHPGLSRLTRCAVYAPELDTVFVFDMGSIKRADLSPLWSLPVVADDGVELLRQFSSLRRGSNQIASTMLMSNGLLNHNEGLNTALPLASGVTLPPDGEDSDQNLAIRALALPQCYQGLFGMLGPRKLPKAVSTQAGAQRAIACLEIAGAPFDAAGHQELISSWTQELNEYAGLLPEGLDPSSHKQARAWLKKIVPAERRSGWVSTSSGTLSTCDANLAVVDDIPEINALREHRRVSKLLNTYGERFAANLHPVTGRLHARWVLGGCVTGRMSCSDPNLLALPRDSAFRALFRAPEGSRLLVADVSQFQLRLAAHIAEDDVMLEAYANGLDLHIATAAALTGKDPKDVTGEERRIAKAANFGLLFGQGVRGFRDYANGKYAIALSTKEAEEIREAWLDTYRGVERWHRRTMRVLNKGGFVCTAGGREGDEEDFRGNALQQALAFQVQGTEAEIMLRALSKMLPSLQEHGGQLALFVHDEVVLEVPEDETAVITVSEVVERSVADAFTHFYAEASTHGLVEVRAVQTWADAK